RLCQTRREISGNAHFKRQVHAREVVAILARLGSCGCLLGTTRHECHAVAGSREVKRESRAPSAGTDDREGHGRTSTTDFTDGHGYFSIRAPAVLTAKTPGFFRRRRSARMTRAR